MASMGYQERTVDQVIEQYVDSRTKSTWPISTSYALLAVRTVLPRCELSDRELADLIVASAIRKGQNISFDS